MTTRSFYRLVLSLVLICLTLTGCRYWSLYQLGQQFCEFDTQIEVTNIDGLVGFDLIDPVLPRSVFQRYFYANPFASYDSNYEQEDRFQVMSMSSTQEVSVSAHYHLGSSTPLLIRGSLDEDLSQLFPVEFVEPILRSVCSDDYDLSLKKLKLRMTLPNIEAHKRPTRNEVMRVFGPALPNSHTSQLAYQLDFLEPHGERQSKVIHLNLSFNQQGVLSKLHVLYHKYDLNLDFENQRAQLIAIRRS